MYDVSKLAVATNCRARFPCVQTGPSLIRRSPWKLWGPIPSLWTPIWSRVSSSILALLPSQVPFRTDQAEPSTMRLPWSGLPPLVLAILSGTAQVGALSAAEWRKQSVYQVVTDRFARSDLSTTAPCDTSQQVYCGGTWQGLISKLGYIQNMGFTAVWISPVVTQVDGVTADGSVLLLPSFVPPGPS